MSEILSKVCGMTRPEDLRLCETLGVDFTGFIFVSSSPRFVSPEFVGSLPKGRSRRVGVFAGESPERMRTCAEIAGLDFFQLHGGEAPETCADLGPGRVIKVLWPERCSAKDLQREMDRFAPVCAFFLLDAGKSGGGSGTCLNFSVLAKLDPPRPWLLAGGLGPHTIGEALACCRPDGVDLNSALEAAPGVKDHGLLRSALKVLATASGGPA